MALKKLDLERLKPKLSSFWPKGGPVWDGLGVNVDTKERFLVEAKAHIPELVSSPSGAKGASLLQIRTQLTRLKRALGSGAPADWSGTFYQYANRLAFLSWLRDNGELAFLVSIYFTNAPDVPKPPPTKEQWEGALTVLRSYLGLGRHGLKEHVVDVFIDTAELSA